MENESRKCKHHGVQSIDHFYACKSSTGTTVYRCKETSKDRRKARYHASPAASNDSVNKWRLSHREESRAINARCYAKNKDKILESMRNVRIEQRKAVLSHYSPDLTCGLCGCPVFEFLVLDHINGDGSEDRKKTGGGDKFYKFILKNGFQDGLRVLCHNCNFKENLRLNREAFESKVWEKTHRMVKMNGKAYPVDLKKQAISLARYRAAVKLQCLVSYSSVVPTCSCCMEDDTDALAIDHIDGGGRKHMRELGVRGQSFYTWLMKSGFPSGYQVLCHNCNFAKHAHGVCPHRRI